MSTATRSSNRHPRRLVSIVYVDGALGGGHDYRRLTCYGAFEVEFDDGSPVFKCHHISTTENNRRAAMMEDLGALSDDRYVLVGSGEAHETFWDRKHILEAGLVYLDIVERVEGIQPTDLNLMGAPEQAFIELAAKFGLGNCYAADLLGQARCAGARAQVMWLAYVATTFGRKETRNLFAAFQAWQALKRARPIPF